MNDPDLSLVDSQKLLDELAARRQRDLDQILARQIHPFPLFKVRNGVLLRFGMTKNACLGWMVTYT